MTDVLSPRRMSIGSDALVGSEGSFTGSDGGAGTAATVASAIAAAGAKTHLAISTSRTNLNSNNSGKHGITISITKLERNDRRECRESGSQQ